MAAMLSFVRRMRATDARFSTRLVAISLLATLSMVAGACSTGTGTDDAQPSPTETSPTETSPTETSPTDTAILRVAVSTEPPTLDWQVGLAAATQLVGIQVYETLFALDADYSPQPMLAEGIEQIDDSGQVWRVRLRNGVNFHNGETMGVADVIASIERWGRVSSMGRAVFELLDSLESTDDSTITFTFTEPYMDLSRALAVTVGAAAIMPRTVIQEAGDTQIEDDANIIGTGPYMLGSWQKGAKYTLERFDDYSMLATESSGLSGAKDAAYATVEVTFVPDPLARFNSVEAGQFDVGLEIPGDLFSSLLASENLTPQTVMPFYSLFTLMNTQNGPFTDQRLREAVRLAIDPTEVMTEVFGDPELFDVSGAIYARGMGVLHSEAGLETFGQTDLEAAKALVAESGYDGEPLTFVATQEIAYVGNSAVSVSQRLEQIGLNVDIEMSEWGTNLELIRDPNEWDLFNVPTGTAYIIPKSHVLLGGAFPFEGWYGRDDEAAAIVGRWNQSPSDEARADLMAELQIQFYEDVPALKLGDLAALHAISNAIDAPEHPEFFLTRWWELQPK